MAEEAEARNAIIGESGENPVSDDAIGDVERMTEAWIDWGRANDLID